MVPAMVTPRPARPRACVFNAVFGFCVVPLGRYVAVMAGGCCCATRREAQGAEHTSPEPTRGFYSVFLAFFCPEREATELVFGLLLVLSVSDVLPLRLTCPARGPVTLSHAYRISYL